MLSNQEYFYRFMAFTLPLFDELMRRAIADFER